MRTITRAYTRRATSSTQAGDCTEATNPDVLLTDGLPPVRIPSLSHARSLGRAHGQSLLEYAMIILFVALAVFLSLLLIAPALNGLFNQVPGLF